MTFELSVSATEMAGRRQDLFRTPEAAGNWILESYARWDCVDVLSEETKEAIGTATCCAAQGKGSGYLEVVLKLKISLRKDAPEGSMFAFHDATLDIKDDELQAIRVFKNDQDCLRWCLAQQRP